MKKTLKPRAQADSETVLSLVGELAVGNAKADSKTVLSLVKAVRGSKNAYALLIRGWAGFGKLETWPQMLKAITIFSNPYKLWYKKKALTQIAQDAQLVEAVRIAAVGGEDVPVEMIAVLALEGSDASIDALMPYVVAACAAKDKRLDGLNAFKRLGVKAPNVLSILKEANSTRDRRIAESPALAVARAIGLPAEPGFFFTASLGSAHHDGRSLPAIQVSLTVDSRDTRWFSGKVFRLSDHTSTSFGPSNLHEDRLNVGVKPPHQWPQWLEGAAKMLKVEWDKDVFISSSVRGAKREQIARWLLSRSHASGA